MWNGHVASCTNHTLDIEKNIVDGPGTTDIHSSCTLTWNFNDDGATVATSGYIAGPNDIIGVKPCYVGSANGNFTPQSKEVSTYGAGDAVTSFAYLGALPGAVSYTCP